jgi:outer membrane protein assembly complex protein YaeT
VELPRVRQTGAELTITVAVTEGARARLAAVRFEGATLPAETLAQRAGLVPGGPYSDADLQRAAGSVRDHYLSLGFPAARVSPELLATPEGDVEAVLRVIEGDAVRIRTIEIVGLTRTHESLVRSKLRLTPGDPLDPRRLAGVEQRVAALGVFASVTVVSSPDDPSVVRVEVVEQAPLVARYDLRYDTEEKGTLLADLEARNIFGRGLTAGARYNVGRRLREARGSFHLPALFGSGTLIGSVFHLEDDVDAVDFFNPGVTITNTRLRRGFEIQQDMRLRRRLNLLYRYRFRRVSSTTFPLPIDIAGLDVSLINETRDKPLDARRGRFLSLNLELTPKILGSDFRFMKATAQASLIHSFRDSLAWAHAYRVGLARGFGGQHLISDDRFRAGGANSLRGFANDSVGPKDILGDASGGEAVVIVNQELRLRHASGIGGAFFYDGGNVFETLGDLSFDWRHSLGIGLRYDTPVGVLLRVDVGFPLGRKPGEKSYQWFFSIGQAF